MSGITWMFSGQGSQYFGMGRTLYDSDPVFQKHMNSCDEIVRMTFGHGFLDSLFDLKNSRGVEFVATSLTKPALFSIQYSLARSLQDQGCRPDRYLGYSLGEFVALCLSGAITVERTIAILAYLTTILDHEVGCKNGGMTAILADFDIISERPDLFGRCEIACKNTKSNFVVSGTFDTLAFCEAKLRADHIVFQRLPVEYAYHSSHIDAAKARFIAEIPTRFAPVQIPVALCSASEMIIIPTAQTLWDTVRKPVRFFETFTKVANEHGGHFVDLGPSGTLATAVRPQVGKDHTIVCMSPFLSEQPSLLKIVEQHEAARQRQPTGQFQRMES